MVVFPLTYKEESILAFNLSAFKLILLDKETVSLPILLVNIAAVSAIFSFSPAVAPVATANVLICLATNKVVAMVLSATVESCVTVTGLPVITGDTMVLLVNVSVPAKVAMVPVVGNIKLLAAVVVMVKSPIPLVIILLASVIVLSLLLTPVPPFVLGKIEVMVPVESENLAFKAEKA